MAWDGMGCMAWDDGQRPKATQCVFCSDNEDNE